MTRNHPNPTSKPATRKSPSPRTIVAAVLAVLAIVFIAENHQSVRIRIIGPVMSMPVWFALAAMFIIGGICGLLLARRRSTR